MTRSTKALIQVAAALVLSIVAGLMVFRWMSANEVKAQAPVLKTVDVVVAAVDLPRGAKLLPEHLKVADYMREAVPGGVFTTPEEVVGRVLLGPMTANEPVTSIRLASEEVRSGGVSSLIKPGHRAMTVKGNKVMGLAGFIRPGDRVDVLVTLLTGERMDTPVTKLVLSNTLVLATGEEFEPSPDGGEPMPVDTYTLELTPEESEQLALAANQGTLNFALRNENDTETVLTAGADVNSTLAAYRTSAPAPKRGPVKQRARKKADVVEIISGSERQSVTF